MSAIEHLQGLVFESRLLAQDTTVAQASGWAGFAQFTTAGRMLPACNAQTISAYEAAITASCQPFAHTTIHAWLRRGQPLICDLDMTGQAVSSTSTTYPDAAFGWMNDQVRRAINWRESSFRPYRRAPVADGLSTSRQHVIEQRST